MSGGEALRKVTKPYPDAPPHDFFACGTSLHEIFMRDLTNMTFCYVTNTARMSRMKFLCRNLQNMSRMKCHAEMSRMKKFMRRSIRVGKATKGYERLGKVYERLQHLTMWGYGSRQKDSLWDTRSRPSPGRGSWRPATMCTLGGAVEPSRGVFFDPPYRPFGIIHEFGGAEKRWQFTKL